MNLLKATEACRSIDVWMVSDRPRDLCKLSSNGQSQQKRETLICRWIWESHHPIGSQDCLGEDSFERCSQWIDQCVFWRVLSSNNLPLSPSLTLYSIVQTDNHQSNATHIQHEVGQRAGRVKMWPHYMINQTVLCCFILWLAFSENELSLLPTVRPEIRWITYYLKSKKWTKKINCFSSFVSVMVLVITLHLGNEKIRKSLAIGSKSLTWHFWVSVSYSSKNIQAVCGVRLSSIPKFGSPAWIWDLLRLIHWESRMCPG